MILRIPDERGIHESFTILRTLPRSAGNASVRAGSHGRRLRCRSRRNFDCCPRRGDSPEKLRHWPHHQTTSDESGTFSVTLLPIGTYEVSAEAQGFKKAVVPDVALRVNDNRWIVFSMEVGQLADQVTVEASAVAVNVSSGTTSQLLDGRDMVKLPSRGRNVLPFALLMPGVVSDTPYDRRNNR
ncbi:MAG: carboxypeptidase-like regulatory domain-containing protein [Bryobacteraceae bacterium]